MHLKPVIAVLAVSLLALTPAIPLLGAPDAGVAFANNGNGGGNGGGNGKGNGGGSEKSKPESAKSKSATADSPAKKPKKAKAELAKAKVGTTADGGLLPNELGKMNGALNANINAVLAHIRNGQISNGPVGLLAGLAVADAGAASADGNVVELEDLAADFDELNGALADEGFATTEDYLQARAEGTLTPEQIARIDPLVEGVGGTDDSGLALTKTKPAPEEILAAAEAATEAEGAVDGAEQAIIGAWNKDGDPEALLTALRDKLAPHQAEIDAAALQEDESAAVLE